MTQQVYISDTNIWIDLRNAGLLDTMFDLPLTLCCTDFVLSELKDFDHQHLLARGLVVETLDELATAALFPLMQAHNNSSLADLSCYQLAQQTGHALLTGDGRLRKQAKADGLPVTCDVGVHHVHLTDLDIGFFDPNAHLIPPLREQRDRDAIRAGLLDGTIDAICSDHTPVDDDAKLLPFAESEAGATGLELLLTLTVKWMREQNVPPARIVKLLCGNPADIIKVQAGSLRTGMPADLCLFNPDVDWVVGEASLISQGKHTPFTGFPMQGKVQLTMVNGNVGYSSLEKSKMKVLVA